MRPAFNPNTPTWKVFLMFLVPMMLANILQSLSGTINNIYLGQMIGVQALAAASSFFPVMFFLMSFVMGLGSGSYKSLHPRGHRKSAEADGQLALARAVSGSRPN